MSRAVPRNHGPRSAAAPFIVITITSLVAIAALILALVWLSRSGTPAATNREPLFVYCAVAVQPALEAIATQYEQEIGTKIQIQSGSSGALEAQIRLSKKGDLFIPASQRPYLDRCRDDGTVTEIVPLASFRLVVAFNPQTNPENVTLDSLLNGELRYAIANEEAAAGLATREAIEPLGKWPQAKQGAKAFFPTVTGVALAIQQGVAVDCGFIWDTTARQYKLPIVDLPELASARATVSAGVLSCSLIAGDAREFADYLAAPAKGQLVFKSLGYEPADSVPP